MNTVSHESLTFQGFIKDKTHTHTHTSLLTTVSLVGITSLTPETVGLEGEKMVLSCKYEGSIYSIVWYQQRERSRPEVMFSITEQGSVSSTVPGFSTHINKPEKHVELQINSAAVRDSAVYYCAVRPGWATLGHAGPRWATLAHALRVADHQPLSDPCFCFFCLIVTTDKELHVFDIN
uniref:Ig-like domain-containing protein n=1 Tax=Cynoglossus semilaevis TaxID=244447 RepID=A0A3P8WJ85_CYNSE